MATESGLVDQQRIKHLARLGALIRAPSRRDAEPSEKRQPAVRRLHTKALFRLIRSIALERVLTDTHVVVEARRRFLRPGRDREQERPFLCGDRHRSTDDERNEQGEPHGDTPGASGYFPGAACRRGSPSDFMMAVCSLSSSRSGWLKSMSRVSASQSGFGSAARTGSAGSYTG